MKLLQKFALTTLFLTPLAACGKKAPAPSNGGVALTRPANASTTPLTDEITDAAAAVSLPGLTTTCTIVDATTIEGSARNDSSNDYLVSGMVEFSFADPSLPHPSMATPANASIPANGSALVVRTHLAFQAKPGSACRLDLGTAVHKR
jgi:hypothetical protein